jgi:isoquinoline 1-oxidoreductase beta subunit
MIAIESTIDECARRAGADPVAFRLAHIDDPRLAGVLARAWARAGETPPPSGDGAGLRTGRGVACGIYKAMSYAATVADVIIAADGTVRVAGLWCAHDCGRIVNPGQVRAQCEGNLVWGLSMALHEGLSFAEGAVVETTLGESGLPRLPDVPEIRVDLLETDAPPTGAGETAIVSAASAILNAIRDATEVRITRLPADPALLRG